MPTAAARPYLVFLFLMGIVVAAESAALASRAMMIRARPGASADHCAHRARRARRGTPPEGVVYCVGA